MTARATTPLVCLLVFVLSLVGASCGYEVRPPEVGRAHDAFSRGRFSEADELLARFEAEAGDLAAAARDSIERTRSHGLRYRKAFAIADALLIEELVEKTRSQVILVARSKLQEAARAGDPYLERAYEARMAELFEPILETAARIRAERHPVVDPVPSAVAETRTEEEFTGPVVENVMTDVLALAEDGRFTDALDALREQIPLAGEGSEKLRETLWSIEGRAREEVAELRAKVDALVASGDRVAALRLIEREAGRFPAVGPLSSLVHARHAIERKILTEKAQRLAAERAVERSARAPEPERKSRRTKRREHVPSAAELAEAAEARYIDAAFVALATAVKRRPRDFRGADLGRHGFCDIVAIEGQRWSVRGRDGDKDLAQHSLPKTTVLALVAKAARGTEARLGAALLAWDLLDDRRAEAFLREALKKDRKSKERVNTLLARQRREDPGPEGYAVVGASFVPARDGERVARARKLVSKVAQVYRKSNDAERDDALGPLLLGIADDRSIVVDSLVAKKRSVLAALAKSPTRTSLQRLRALRVELDKRRAFAKDLIFDAKRYFYPYRPPAVSAAKAKAYAKVQAEVDRRVAAVREIWDGKKLVLTLPKTTAAQVDLFRWITVKLGELGEATPEEDRDFDLLFAKQRVDVRNVALDARDAKRLERWAAIVEENEVVFAELLKKKHILPSEVALHRLTNAYRLMFGHRPLHCDVRLVRAIHKHCAEMSLLGYFSHYSPTSGRRTPGERMRLEGYPRGTGENLAKHFSPGSALNAWQHSSGHHRNMLNPAHVDLGCGNDGAHWGQNFGRR